MTRRTATPKDISFTDQLRAIGMNDKSIKDVTFSYADHQYLVRLLNDRDIAVIAESKEYLEKLYIADNDALCKNVAEVVRGELAETLAPFYRQMAEIATSIEGINKSLEDMGNRLGQDEKIIIEIESRITKLEFRFNRYSSLFQTVLRNVITAAISIGVAIILILEIHSKL